MIPEWFVGVRRILFVISLGEVPYPVQRLVTALSYGSILHSALLLRKLVFEFACQLVYVGCLAEPFNLLCR